MAALLRCVAGYRQTTTTVLLHVWSGLVWSGLWAWTWTVDGGRGLETFGMQAITAKLGGFVFACSPGFWLLDPVVGPLHRIPDQKKETRREIAETLRCSGAVAECRTEKNKRIQGWIRCGFGGTVGLRHLRGQRTARGLLSINVMSCALSLRTNLPRGLED